MDGAGKRVTSQTQPSWLRWFLTAATVATLLLAMDTLRLFGGQQWLGDLIWIESQYFYGLLLLLLPFAYFSKPTRWWIDVPLAVGSVVLLLMLLFTAEQALDEAWEFAAPNWAVWAAATLWVY